MADWELALSVGVVAIGRNEGGRLRACLASAVRDCPAVVYVDSGSTDGSADLARSMGVHVVDLDLSKPFTAARARNEGFALLRQIAPAVDRVQFVDGDCEIVPGWIAAAEAALAGDPKTAIVCGRRRERFPAASVYNKLCDMEWNTPVGVALACGGDAMVRVDAFEQVGGYDGTVIAGEEPEMCVRLRHAGWTVRRIDAEDDAARRGITRFGQWVAADGPQRPRLRPGQRHARRPARAVPRTGGPPDRTLGPCGPSWRRRFWSRCWRSSPHRWCWLGLAPAGPVPADGRQGGPLPNGPGDPVGDSWVYGVFVTIGKFPRTSGRAEVPLGATGRAAAHDHRVQGAAAP